jgi:hypothetical protein
VKAREIVIAGWSPAFGEGIERGIGFIGVEGLRDDSGRRLARSVRASERPTLSYSRAAFSSEASPSGVGSVVAMAWQAMTVFSHSRIGLSREP